MPPYPFKQKCQQHDFKKIIIKIIIIANGQNGSAGKCQTGARAVISITKAADKQLAFIMKSEAEMVPAALDDASEAAQDILIDSFSCCKL